MGCANLFGTELLSRGVARRRLPPQPEPRRGRLQVGNDDAADDQRRAEQTLQAELLAQHSRAQHSRTQRAERTEHPGALSRGAALRDRLQRKAEAAAYQRQREHHRPRAAA